MPPTFSHKGLAHVSYSKIPLTTWTGDIFRIHTTKFSKMEQDTPLWISTEVIENKDDIARETIRPLMENENKSTLVTGVKRHSLGCCRVCRVPY